MSEVLASGISNCATGSELSYRNHCNPTPEPFAPGMRSVGLSLPLGSLSRRYLPGQVTSGEVFGRASKRRGNTHGYKSHRRACDGRGPGFSAGQIGIEQAVGLPRCTEARTAMEDCGKYGECRCADSGHASPAERILRHFDGSKGGARQWR